MIYSRSTLHLGQDLKDACSSSTEEGVMDCMEHKQQALCNLDMCSEVQATWCGQSFGCFIRSSRRAGQNVSWARLCRNLTISKEGVSTAGLGRGKQPGNGSPSVFQ